MNSDTKRTLTVREAGRRGGTTTARRRGPEFYREIGRKGGQRMRELLARGREREEQAAEGQER
jgi:general stress protein YciG